MKTTAEEFLNSKGIYSLESKKLMRNVIKWMEQYASQQPTAKVTVGDISNLIIELQDELQACDESPEAAECIALKAQAIATLCDANPDDEGEKKVVSVEEKKASDFLINERNILNAFDSHSTWCKEYGQEVMIFTGYKLAILSLYDAPDDEGKEYCNCETEKDCKPNKENKLWICGKCNKPY